MKFYFDSKKCFYRDELHNDFMLMSLLTNQTYDLPAEYRSLLKLADRWVDFERFWQMAQFMSFGLKGNLRAQAERIIFQLAAGGVVQLAELPQSDFSGVHPAELRDFHRLAEFCRENCNSGLSCAVNNTPAVYADSVVYNDLENSKIQVMLLEDEGNIKAACFGGLSDYYFGGLVFALKSFIFDKAADKETVKKYVSEMLKATAAEITAKGDSKINKIRYEYMNPRQDVIVSLLTENGFKKTAVFKDEIREGTDLVLYDFPVNSPEQQPAH